MVNFRPIQDSKESSSESISKVNFRPIKNTSPDLQGSSQSVSTEVPSTNLPGSAGLAVIGGLSNAGANIGETVLDAGTWLMEKVGAVSPSTKKQLDKYISEGVKPFKVTEKDNDVFGQALREHPYISKASELAVEVPALVKTAISGIGSGLTGSATGLAGNVGVNALLSAGMTEGGTEAQDKAAKWSVPLTLGTTAVGAGINKFVKGSTLIDDLKNYVHGETKPINEALSTSGKSLTDKAMESTTALANKVKEVADANWTPIKEIPGTINGSGIKQQLKYMVEQNGNVLEKPQLAAIQDLSRGVDNLKTMEDALELKKVASSYYQEFQGKGAIYSIYNNIKSNIDDAIEAKAADAGKAGDYKFANKYHRENVVPLQELNAFEIAKATENKAADPTAYGLQSKTFFTKVGKSPEMLDAVLKTMDDKGSEIFQQKFLHDTFQDMVNSPEGFNPNTALKKINTFKSQFGSKLSRETNETLDGIKTLMQNAGAVAGKKPSTLGTKIAQYSMGSGLGAAGGFMVGGPVGSAIGAAVGAGSSGAATNAISHLLQTPTGLKFLRYIGSGKPGSSVVSKLIATELPAYIASMGRDNTDE